MLPSVSSGCPLCETRWLISSRVQRSESRCVVTPPSIARTERPASAISCLQHCSFLLEAATFMFTKFQPAALALGCTVMGPQGAVRVRNGLFAEYALDDCYDEMFDRSGEARQPYDALHRRLLELSPADLRHRQQDADSAFLHQGVTFTVYGDDQGTERIFPYDLLPRILTAREWE